MQSVPVLSAYPHLPFRQTPIRLSFPMLLLMASNSVVEMLPFSSKKRHFPPMFKQMKEGSREMMNFSCESMRIV